MQRQKREKNRIQAARHGTADKLSQIAFQRGASLADGLHS